MIHKGVSCSLETRSHDFTHDLGVVYNIIAFLSETETWRNLPDVFFTHPSKKKKYSWCMRLALGMEKS